MAQRKVNPIVPFDIRGFRQGLGITQRELGVTLALHLHGPGSLPVPSSRINEWERHVRTVPDDVYTGCAEILISIWQKGRADKRRQIQRDLDIQFAALLSPALSSAMEMEYAFIDRKDREGRQTYNIGKKVRHAIQVQLESLLHINLSTILDPR
jgi:hypothetical protein